MKRTDQLITAALPVLAIATQIVSPHGITGMAAWGILTAVGSVLPNLVADVTQKSRDTKDALKATLQNHDLALAAAEAASLVILDNSNDANARSAKALAECAKSYWMHLHSDPQLSSFKQEFAENELPKRIIEYVTDAAGTARITKGDWAEFLTKAASSCKPPIEVEAAVVEQMAAALETGYAKQLYNAFKSDLRRPDGGAAFAGIVLRLLGQLSVDLQASRKEAGENRTELLRAFDVIGQRIVDESKQAPGKLDAATDAVIREIQTLRDELPEQIKLLREDISGVKEDTASIKETVAIILQNQATLQKSLIEAQAMKQPQNDVLDRCEALRARLQKGFRPSRRVSLKQLRDDLRLVVEVASKTGHPTLQRDAESYVRSALAFRNLKAEQGIEESTESHIERLADENRDRDLYDFPRIGETTKEYERRKMTSAS